MIRLKDNTSAKFTAKKLAQLATEALLEEVNLSPKPGLVDRFNNGTHRDLSLQLMERSAHALQDCFQQMAEAAWNKKPSQQLREQLAAIGRYGEEQMLKATGKVNTHRGAIWAIGLITAAASFVLSRDFENEPDLTEILNTAGQIATHEDRYLPKQNTNGDQVRIRYNVRSAKEEAKLGFPSIINTAMAAWENYAHLPVDTQRLHVLLALMSEVDDTCILHRSDMQVLEEIQSRSKFILQNGGLNARQNWRLYFDLEDYITHQWVSPGGSADLLAATIYLQKIKQYF